MNSPTQRLGLSILHCPEQALVMHRNNAAVERKSSLLSANLFSLITVSPHSYGSLEESADTHPSPKLSPVIFLSHILPVWGSLAHKREALRPFPLIPWTSVLGSRWLLLDMTCEKDHFYLG